MQCISGAQQSPRGFVGQRILPRVGKTQYHDFGGWMFHKVTWRWSLFKPKNFSWRKQRRFNLIFVRTKNVFKFYVSHDYYDVRMWAYFSTSKCIPLFASLLFHIYSHSSGEKDINDIIIDIIFHDYVSRDEKLCTFQCVVAEESARIVNALNYLSPSPKNSWICTRYGFLNCILVGIDFLLAFVQHEIYTVECTRRHSMHYGLSVSVGLYSHNCI